MADGILRISTITVTNNYYYKGMTESPYPDTTQD